MLLWGDHFDPLKLVSLVQFPNFDIVSQADGVIQEFIIGQHCLDAHLNLNFFLMDLSFLAKLELVDF